MIQVIDRICRKRTTIVLVMLFWVALACCQRNTAVPTASTNELSKTPFYVVGHRGGAGLAPENTLSSFARACEIGVDAIELDVLLSADGQVVVYHDYRLKPEITRMPDGSWLKTASPPIIKDLTVADLKRYDVGRLKPGTRYARRYPDQTPVDGERIPTLGEVIRLIQTTCPAATQLWVEIKTSPESPGLTAPPETVSKKVIQVLRDQTALNRARILSFDWRNLVVVQKIAPTVSTVYLSIEGARFNNIKSGQPQASPWLAGLDIDDFAGSVPHAIRAAGGLCWAPYYRHLTGSDLQAAHELGIKVFVWTP